MTNFSKPLSKEVGPAGIRVNIVSPRPVATDIWLGANGIAESIAQTNGVDPGAIAEQAAAGAVAGRLTQPSEIADLVVYLASDRAGKITGAGFVIDGGLSATT